MKPPRCRWPETACRPRGDIYNGVDGYSFFKEMHMASRAVSIGLTFVCAATLSACAGNREIPAADLAAAQTTTIGVNPSLWRAGLDPLSFAPLAQVDSACGVLATAWYSPPTPPGKRVWGHAPTRTCRPPRASRTGAPSLPAQPTSTWPQT